MPPAQLIGTNLSSYCRPADRCTTVNRCGSEYPFSPPQQGIRIGGFDTVASAGVQGTDVARAGCWFMR